MTFPFFPNRSSSDDDALDHQLNEWAIGSNTDPASDEVADAFEFHRWADNTRRSDPAATGPAAGTWNRVLRNSAQGSSKRSSAMSSATLTAQSPGFSRIPEESFRQRSGRYATLAATVAIVLTVAFGGWLAMSQMPGGGGDGRFAALQGTPEVVQSQTCDVKPLTVDEVVAIVENPYSTIDSSWWGTPVPGEKNDETNQIQNQELLEWPLDPIPYPGGGASFSVPESEDFEEASAFTETLFDCVQNGTMGQMWSLQSPITVQNSILSQFQVYRDRSEVRSHIESVIDEPYPYSNQDVYSGLKLTPNPRVGDARIWDGEGNAGLDFSKVMYIGVQAVDSNGSTVVAENFEGVAVEGDRDRGNGVAYILVYSESHDQWFFHSVYAPRG